MRKRAGRFSSRPSFYKLILALVIMLCSLVFVYVFKNKLDKNYKQNTESVKSNKILKKDIDMRIRYDENDKKYLDKIIKKLGNNQKD